MTGIATITIDGRDIHVRSIDGRLWVALDDLGSALDSDRIATAANAQLAKMSDIDSYPTPDAATQIKRWIADRVVFSPTARTWAHDLYVDYIRWSTRHNTLPVTETMFGRMARKAGWDRRSASKRKRYHGIGIVDATDTTGDDHFVRFARDCLIFDGKTRTSSSNLYVNYRSWCHDQRVEYRSQTAFGRWLGEVGRQGVIRRTPICGRTHYRGVAIRSDMAQT